MMNGAPRGPRKDHLRGTDHKVSPETDMVKNTTGRSQPNPVSPPCAPV